MERQSARRTGGTGILLSRKLWLLWALAFVLYPAVLPAQTTRTLWVGESVECDASSAAMGLTSDVSWSQSGGYIQLSGSGMYRRATATQYFSGTATVRCTWKYRLYSGDTWKAQSRTWTFRCNDNPVQIAPSTMTLSVGESGYVGYSLTYQNQYTSAAAPYFSSSNPSVATVSASGEVTAVGPGTAYVNVYSKVSSNAPYCTVTVRSVPVEEATIPSTLSVVAGQTRTLSLRPTPANGTVESASWRTTDASVATVGAGGTVRGVHHGTTTVYCVVNGSVRSNDCTVTVTKATLTLTADRESGLVEAGTRVGLTASDPAADIYYTLDGSQPTRQSLHYDGPVAIDHSLTLRAVALHEDYLDSEVLMREFEATSLRLARSYPAEGAEGLNYETVPSLSFSQPVAAGDSIGGVKLLCDGSPVPGRAVVCDSLLYYVSDERLTEGTYTLNVPTRAVRSEDGEVNLNCTLSFTTQEKPLEAEQVFISPSYMVDSRGTLWAWGDNNVRRPFGTDRDEPFLSPVKIIENVSKVAKGSFNELMAIITKNGDLYRWGDNDYGQIGDGTKTVRRSPVKVLSNVKDVSLGSFTTLALKTDGSLWGWGNNRRYQVGCGYSSSNSGDQLTPAKVMDDVKDVSAAAYHAFAVKTDGSLWAWGWNEDGLLFGPDHPLEYYETPVQVMSEGVASVIAESERTYVLKTDGSLWTWGNNECGLLGDGTTTSRTYFAKVMDSILSIEIGSTHVWAIKRDSSLWAWGFNPYGSFGTGFAEDTLLKPCKILDNVRKVDGLGNLVTAVIKNDGTLWICGEYTGLKNDNVNDRYRFWQLMDNIKDVEVSSYSGGYIKNDGSLWTWGSRIIGNGKEEGSKIPVKIFPVIDSTSISRLEFASLNVERLELPMMTEAVLQVHGKPEKTAFTVTWSSSDETVAKVSARGVVTGLTPGTTTITAHIWESDDELFQALTCKVIVGEAPTAISDVRQGEPFAVRVEGGALRVEGLARGEAVRVYDATGRLVAETRAEGATASVALGGQGGVYVVRTDGGRAAKVVVRI